MKLIPTFTGICPKHYVEFSGMCYRLFLTPKNWTNAEEACRADGEGHLAAITDTMPDAALAGLVNSSSIPADFWIGGHLNITRWKWASGKKSS